MKPTKCTLLLKYIYFKFSTCFGQLLAILKRTYCCTYATMVFFTLYGWLSGLQTRQTPIQTATHPDRHPSRQPPIQKATHPYSHPTRQTSIQTATQPDSHPSRQPPIQTATQPDSHPSRQPPNQTATHPDSHPSRQPPIQTATHTERKIPWSHKYSKFF